MFLGHGANTDARYNDGFTPLHLAVFSGEYDTVEVLIEHGTSADVKSNDISTPLHIASSAGHSNIISLLGHGADLNSHDICDMTPLHVATYNRQLEAVRLLL